MPSRAADLLVDCLTAHGADRAFCVPGESYLAVLDALYMRNDVETVVCRHEGGAGFMAVADAKLTGRAGIAFCSRGPGATNASIAVHVAEQDAVPLILFIGQVPRHELGRGAFQEVDYAQMFGGFAKLVVTVDDAARLPEVIARAFLVAETPTPGPVVIVLPEDMLEDETGAEPMRPFPVPRGAPPAPEQVSDVVSLLARAERPLVLAGGALAHPKGRLALRAASEALDLPVALTFKRQEIFPNAHPNYAGHLGFKIPKPLVALYAESDLVIAVGTRLTEVTTQGYTFPKAPDPIQPLVHVHADARHLGRNVRPTIAVAADPTAFLLALAGTGRPTGAPSRAQWIERLSAPWKAARAWKPPADGLLDMGAVVAAFAGRIAEDAVFITDAGNFSGWLHRHWAFNGRQLMIGAVGGAMGIGMPAAIAAGMRLKGRQIVTFLGDGGALMTGSELATAVRHGVPVKIFISNNSSYGTIRLHQERAYKGRVVGTELKNPDFARWAESFGAKGLTIRTLDEVDRVVAEAIAHDGPVVVDVVTAVEHIAPGLRISDL
ncbi:MAG: thiamine pyrophosphate-binding protein [Hyphomicrobiaceae bacterium]